MVMATKPRHCSFSMILFAFVFFIIFVYLFTTRAIFYSSPVFSRRSHHIIQRIVSAPKVENELARARFAIRKASRTKSFDSYGKDQEFIPRGSIYRNPYAFHQSYIEMERRFKIWVYEHGDPPLFHAGPMKEIYSIEGHLIDHLESPENPFAAANPDEAHVFFLPISIAKIVHFLYLPRGDYDRKRLHRVADDYLSVASHKYPYWNRSNGADHFFASCHDWAPEISLRRPHFKNLIRVLCNANTSEGFDPKRDATLPEIKIGYNLTPMNLNQIPCGDRPILASFAGGLHGSVRKRLFEYWKNKDKDIQVHEYLPKNISYPEMLSKSKFCICASGYEVASPRLIESFHAGCVPVIVSDGYSLPFSDVLDWTKFSVHIPVDKIPEMKKILQGIGEDEYREKQENVFKVKRHFVLHRPPQAYDLLNMVIHSVWLRRLNLRLNPVIRYTMQI